MKNILLPTDFSENSRQAIAYALKFCSGQPCNFYFLNLQKSSGYLTAEILHASPTSSIYEGILSDKRQELEKMVSYFKGISKGEDFTFHTQIDFDDIVNAVNQSVEANKIDLIIMGTKGATGAAGVLFGSNALQLIRNASCPVLTVPAGYTFESIQSVLLSLQPQDQWSRASFGIVSQILKRHDADLKILALQEGDTPTPPAGFSWPTTETKTDYYSIKDVPTPMAISAFVQLIPVQLHAFMVVHENFWERLFFGSDTSRISHGSQVPLLALRS